MSRLTVIALVGASSIVAMLIAIRGTAFQATRAPAPESKAIQNAEAFLRACALPPSTAMVRARLQSIPGNEKWIVEWEGDYRVSLEANTCAVHMFVNKRREHEQFRNIGRTGRDALGERRAAEEHVLGLARAIGIPTGTILERLEIIGEGAAGRTDANRAGKVLAEIRPRAYGYRYLRGGPGMVFTVDRQDGVLVRFSQAWAIDPDSPALRLTSAEASKIADGPYQDYYRNRKPGPHGAQRQGPRAPEIGYVVPNGQFGGLNRGPGPRLKARLAWVVYFNQETVWIDAESGSVLGGEIFG